MVENIQLTQLPPLWLGWTIAGRVQWKSSARKGHPSEYYSGLWQLNLRVPWDPRLDLGFKPSWGKNYSITSSVSYNFRWLCNNSLSSVLGLLNQSFCFGASGQYILQFLQWRKREVTSPNPLLYGPTVSTMCCAMRIAEIGKYPDDNCCKMTGHS